MVDNATVYLAKKAASKSDDVSKLISDTGKEGRIKMIAGVRQENIGLHIAHYHNYGFLLES